MTISAMRLALALSFAALILCVYYGRERARPVQKIVWVNTVLWLTNSAYTLEHEGKSYQTGLREDGVVVWREVKP